MRQQIEVVYEQGVLRPLGPLPIGIQEHQHLTVTIEGLNGSKDWLADADPSVSLETVRQILAKVPYSLAKAVDAEREER